MSSLSVSRNVACLRKEVGTTLSSYCQYSCAILVDLTAEVCVFIFFYYSTGTCLVCYEYKPVGSVEYGMLMSILQTGSISIIYQVPGKIAVYNNTFVLVFCFR